MPFFWKNGISSTAPDMAKEKEEPEEVVANDWVEGKTPKPPKQWQYVGPKPAPLISNLPIDLKQPRLGSVQEKYPADDLPEKYIEYVRATAPHTRGWWK
jgi:hypothetical protein